MKRDLYYIAIYLLLVIATLAIDSAFYPSCK